MRYDLWQAEREKAEVLECGLKVIRQFDNPLRPVLKIWKPKATKPYAHYSFKSIGQAEDYIIKQIENMKAHQERKTAYKAERAGTPEMLSQVKEGMIFHASWGYDQTNNDFYQVVAVNGRMVTVREIASQQTGESVGNSMAANVVALKDHFLENKEPLTKKIQFGSGSQPSLKMASYSYATPWDGRPCYESWYA